MSSQQVGYAVAIGSFPNQNLSSKLPNSTNLLLNSSLNTTPPTQSYSSARFQPPLPSNSPLLSRLNATKLNPFDDILAFKPTNTPVIVTKQNSNLQSTAWNFDAIDSGPKVNDTACDIFDIGFLNEKNSLSTRKNDDIDELFASLNVSGQSRDRNITTSTDQDIDDIFSTFDRAPIIQPTLMTQSPPRVQQAVLPKTTPTNQPRNDTSRDESISLILSKGFPLQSIISALDLTSNDPTLALLLLQEDFAVRYPNSTHPSLHSSPQPSTHTSPSHSHSSYNSYSSVVDSASRYGLSFVMGAKKVLDASRKKLVGVVKDMQIDDDARGESYGSKSRRGESERVPYESYRDDPPITNAPTRLENIFDTVISESRDERISDLLNMNDDQPVHTFTPRSQFSTESINHTVQKSPSDFYRDQGNTLFKSGQYSEAIDLYTLAMTHLPQPVTLASVAILNNRALAYLKTGQARCAVEDCTASIEVHKRALIVKSDTLSKSYFRRGAAFEALEKYNEAGEDYRSVIGGDVNGVNISAAREGLMRCLNALKVTQNLQSKTAPTQPPKKTSQVVERTVAEAVEKLRAGHRQLDAEDDQRMLLVDQVDLRINTWKSGKETNLRGLLCGLQDVLWVELAWIPVGLCDLITVAQVKVKYMRAISKVHPDKVGQVSVENKMISNGVFSILNNAWDAFKTQNALK